MVRQVSITSILQVLLLFASPKANQFKPGLYSRGASWSQYQNASNALQNEASARSIAIRPTSLVTSQRNSDGPCKSFPSSLASSAYSFNDCIFIEEWWTRLHPPAPVVDFVMASASQSDPILYEEDERSSVSRITLNRPRVLNAINTSLLGGLVQALTRVQVRRSSDVNEFA